jgi:outer membrane protein OmpA-like peptidoglycan-associated protein
MQLSRWSVVVATLMLSACISLFSLSLKDLAGRLQEDPHLRVQLLADNEILVQVPSGDSFDRDSVIPTATLTGVLDNIVKVLGDSAEKYEITVQGYTDDVGTQQANIQTSSRRAMSVRRYLIGKGFNEKFIFAEGKGIENPLASNTTQEGRDVNRRTDLRIRPRQVKTQ